MDDGGQTTDDGGQTAEGGKHSPKRKRRDNIRNPTYDIRDTIVVQGIIDMLIRTPQDLVVIDFKTDNISAAQALDRAELYRTQLDAYAKAAARILNVESTVKYLYFLTPRVVVPL